MQGGGKDKLNTVTSNQPTVYMFLPMEVISSPQQKQWFTDFVRIMTKMAMTSH